MLPKSCGKDVEAAAENTTRQEISTWRWDFLCTDGEDIEELNEMFGPLCWQGYENDHGGFKKLMWCGITKEFNCNATSTRSKCGRDKGDGFHAPTNKKKRQEW